MAKLFAIEADQVDIEIGCLKGRKFGSEEVFIPAGVQRKLVVRDDVGSLLCFAQMIEDDYGYFLEPEFPGCEQTAMAGDDACVGIHQDGIVEAELRYAGGDLRNLCLGVRPGVPGERDKLVEHPMLDAVDQVT